MPPLYMHRYILYRVQRTKGPFPFSDLGSLRRPTRARDCGRGALWASGHNGFSIFYWRCREAIYTRSYISLYTVCIVRDVNCELRAKVNADSIMWMAAAAANLISATIWSVSRAAKRINTRKIGCDMLLYV